jgi:HEAT repeat protein
MEDQVWNEIVLELNSRDANRAADAASRLDAQAGLEDVPQLLLLLNHEDFFIREAAAWPLSHLVGPQVLPQLFAAYQRGFDDGHDNDGFTAALLDMNRAEAKNALKLLLESGDDATKFHAAWLLEFC